MRDSGQQGFRDAGLSEITDSERYSRQILFDGIKAGGQQRLAHGNVAIVGVGATGTASASLLARAGIGRLVLVDRDFVEPSNLQRQVLFDEDDAAKSTPKAEAARRQIARFNSSINVEAQVADVTPRTVDQLLAECDLVLDCTDNFETRYLLNDYCVCEGKAWIYAAAVGSYAATMNVLPQPASHQPARWPTEPTACLACVFPSPPQGNIVTCDTAGILASAVNFAASLQVTEAIKFLTGQAEIMRRTLISFDLWTGERAELSSSSPRVGCEVCEMRTFRHLAGEGRPHITLCGRNSVQIHEHHRPVDLTELEKRLSSLGRVRTNGMLLRFECTPYTLTVFPDGRALVQGTTDVGIARALYARFIGN